MQYKIKYERVVANGILGDNNIHVQVFSTRNLISQIELDLDVSVKSIQKCGGTDLTARI